VIEAGPLPAPKAIEIATQMATELAARSCSRPGASLIEAG